MDRLLDYDSTYYSGCYYSLDSYSKQLSLRSKWCLSNYNKFEFAFWNYPCYIGHDLFCKTVPIVSIKTHVFEELNILIYFSTPENITFTEFWCPMKISSLFTWCLNGVALCPYLLTSYIYLSDTEGQYTMHVSVKRR